MNPIFQNPIMKQQINLQSDPRQQAINALQKMSPQQLQKIKGMLPRAQAMAQKFGIDFSSVAAEINKL